MSQKIISNYKVRQNGKPFWRIFSDKEFYLKKNFQCRILQDIVVTGENKANESSCHEVRQYATLYLS